MLGYFVVAKMKMREESAMKLVEMDYLEAKSKWQAKETGDKELFDC